MAAFAEAVDALQHIDHADRIARFRRQQRLGGARLEAIGAAVESSRLLSIAAWIAAGWLSTAGFSDLNPTGAALRPGGGEDGGRVAQDFQLCLDRLPCGFALRLFEPPAFGVGDVTDRAEGIFGTDLIATYDVGGWTKDGLGSLAGPVDGMLGAQLASLSRYVEGKRSRAALFGRWLLSALSAKKPRCHQPIINRLRNG